MQVTAVAVKAVLEEIRDSVDKDFAYDREKPGNWMDRNGETMDYADSEDGYRGSCAYRNGETNEPACIVGVALDKLGLLPEETGIFEGDSALSVISVLDIDMDHDAVWMLRNAQSAQDDGCTWHGAIESALG